LEVAADRVNRLSGFVYNRDVAVLSGGRMWHVSAAFVIAGALSASLVSVVAVYFLGWHDSKFDDALESALQITLFGMALALLVASVVFVLVLAMRGGGKAGSNSLWRAGVLGAAYPIGIVLLERVLVNFDSESLANFAVALGYVVLYPAAVALAMKKVP
jgi:hypothetical protein